MSRFVVYTALIAFIFSGQIPAPKKQTTKQGVLAPRSRLFLIKPKGYVHAGTYSVPGYYTLMIFSAHWCVPCSKVREGSLGWLKSYPNLVIVDLDIGSTSESGLSQESSAILADLGHDVTLPAAMLFSPFGIYLNAGNGQQLAPAVSGFESITMRLAGLSKRRYQTALDMHGEAVLNSLRTLEGAKLHYAYSSLPPLQEKLREKAQTSKKLKDAKKGAKTKRLPEVPDNLNVKHRF